jgi:hypothetical protein
VALEKQTTELPDQLRQQQQAADLDLQAKCGKNAKTWFDEHWSVDKNTTLLDYSNHYNKSINKCFVLAHRNYWMDTKSPYLMKTAHIYDVYENLERGSVTQLVAPAAETTDTVSANCTTDGVKNYGHSQIARLSRRQLKFL